MCGIAGVFNYSAKKILPEQNRKAFADPLKFRGPDDFGNWHYSNDRLEASLFHARLSIIDLNETGHQPMTTPDGNVVIVFNGEIYNYQQLKSELSGKGFSFNSTSDTEVLLQGYRCWGFETLLSKIDGMFAIVLFDKATEEVWMARDRFGKKPLYYYADEKSLIFSSDIRSFYKIPSLSLSLDVYSLGYFFAEQSTPRVDSIWKEIKKLKAAHCLNFKNGKLLIRPYWSLSFSVSNTLSWQDTLEHTETLLRESVKKRLVADVPVAAQLSGGIDSSLVVAMMAQVSSSPVRTYTVTFDDASLDESKYAQLVSKTFGTTHTELRLTQMDTSLIDNIIIECSEPFADASTLSTHLICKEISKSEKVVCGGDGGDELFGGYYINHFVNKLMSVRKFRSLEFLSKFASSIIPAYRLQFLTSLLKAANRPEYQLLNRNIAFSQSDLEKLSLPELAVNALNVEHKKIWQEFSSPELSLSKNTLASFLHTRLVNDYLVKVDRASMYASLEMRSPFLDKDLASFAATLPDDQLFKRSGPKSVLKGIAEKYFSKDFVHRHKMGFGAPVAGWLRGEFKTKFEEVVLGGKQSLIPLNYLWVKKLLDKHVAGEDHSERLWTLYVFHVWANSLK